MSEKEKAPGREEEEEEEEEEECKRGGSQVDKGIKVERKEEKRISRE